MAKPIQYYKVKKLKTRKKKVAIPARDNSHTNYNWPISDMGNAGLDEAQSITSDMQMTPPLWQKAKN